MRRPLLAALALLTLFSVGAQSPSPGPTPSVDTELPGLDDAPGGDSSKPKFGDVKAPPPGAAPAPAASVKSAKPPPPPPPLGGDEIPPAPAAAPPPIVGPSPLPNVSVPTTLTPAPPPVVGGHKGPPAVQPSKRHHASGGGGGSSEPRGVRPPRKQFTSAVQCAQCHDKIYDEWALSMHARSFDDPLFKTALARAQNARGSRIREQCYSCHAPIAVVSGDYGFRKGGAAREGITCDVCHSITSVDAVYEAPLHFTLAPGVQQGPLKDSSAPHPVAYSHLSTQSRLCAACHQGKLDVHADFNLFDTYGEWERSKYNTDAVDVRSGYGRTEVPTRCQECHMAPYNGAVAKDGPWRTEAHGHLFPGAQNEGIVGSALTFSMTARKSPDRRTLFVTVQTHNKNAGHCIPTDFPDRRMVVEVVGISRDYRECLREVRRYGKVFQDKKGRSPVPFWNAESIANDNRIQPGEVRTEHFTFNLTDDVAEVRAQLQYWHVGDDLAQAYRTKIQPMVIEERKKDFGR